MARRSGSVGNDDTIKLDLLNDQQLERRDAMPAVMLIDRQRPNVASRST
jgi:hypothetical protein